LTTSGNFLKLFEICKVSRVPQDFCNQFAKFHGHWITVRGGTSHQAALANRFQQPDEEQVQNTAISQSSLNQSEIYKDDSAHLQVLNQSVNIQIQTLSEESTMNL
jgi:hypothetical protein